MQFIGVILHHSVCPSINGKGYDYFITKDCLIVPGQEPTSPDFIHVCMEGDFGLPAKLLSAEQLEQLFVLQKLILTLSKLYGFSPDDLFPHTQTCPGNHFPWHKLVISMQDGYH